MLHSQFMLSQRPRVASARAAKHWIRELPLTDARAAHHAIETLLTEFDETGLSARDRLEILETVRPHRIEVDAQYSQRYAGKALPLGDAERTAFGHAGSLWQKLEDSYWHCARAAAAGEPDLRPHLALCLARAAGLACERIIGALRAGQALDGTLQASLARYANFAREHGALNNLTPDSDHPKGQVSVALIQHRALLIALTGGTVNSREREAVFELAMRWESKIAVTWLPAGLARALTRADLPASTDAGKQRIRIVHSGGQTYFLDVTALSRSLRKRLHLLGLGQGIDEMGLPASFPHSGAAKLLTRLHGAWCEDEYGRRHPRSAPPSASGVTHQVALAPGGDNFNAMYCLVSGEPFAVNDDSDITSRRRFDEMFIFQGAGHARREKHLREAQRHIEQWHTVDQSAAGARLARNSAGSRFKAGNLAALRGMTRGFDGTAQLAEVRWCAESAAVATNGNPGSGNGAALEAGLEILAHAPVGVAIRLTGINVVGTNHWVAAFRAESGAGSHILVMPMGWYKPGRILEMCEPREEKARVSRWLLGPLKRRGTDFELVEAAPTV